MNCFPLAGDPPCRDTHGLPHLCLDHVKDLCEGGGSEDVSVAAMHHVAGPLAMVTPLHTFDPAQRLGRHDEESITAASVTSVTSHGQAGGPHPSHGGHGSHGQPEQNSPPRHDPTGSGRHDPDHGLPLPSTSASDTQQPTFHDPSDQAQFETDKRSIYK